MRPASFREIAVRDESGAIRAVITKQGDARHWFVDFGGPRSIKCRNQHDAEEVARRGIAQ